jgi:hypothetical protein
MQRMKKFLLIIIVSLVLTSAISQITAAAPCYGTKLPNQGELFSGIQTYSLIKRDLKDNYGRLRSVQHFFNLTYGALDWLSVDLKIGAGNIKQHPIGNDEIDYTSSFAGGYGFRIKLFENTNNSLKAVFGFQHISVHPRSVRINGVKNKAVLDDWQTSLLLSKDILGTSPYVGLKWSRVDYIHWIEEDRKRKMSDLTNDIGIVMGIDIPFSDTVWINLEGHFLDEKAAALAVMFKF